MLSNVNSYATEQEINQKVILWQIMITGTIIDKEDAKYT